MPPTGQPSALTPCLTWGAAAQRRQVAPQGHTASRRQSQGQLRHTQKTDGHTLCPGQSWPVECPPGGKESPPDLGLWGICVLARGPGTLINAGGRFRPAGPQEGNRPLRGTAAVLSPQLRQGSPGSHTRPAAALQVHGDPAPATQSGEWAPGPLPDARDLNGGHTPSQRGPGPSPASSRTLTDELYGCGALAGRQSRKGHLGPIPVGQVSHRQGGFRDNAPHQ